MPGPLPANLELRYVGEVLADSIESNKAENAQHFNCNQVAAEVSCGETVAAILCDPGFSMQGLSEWARLAVYSSYTCVKIPTSMCRRLFFCYLVNQPGF